VDYCPLGTIYYSIENHHRRKTWEAYYEAVKVTNEKPRAPFTQYEEEENDEEENQ
jgi:hypothetical protein